MAKEFSLSSPTPPSKEAIVLDLFSKFPNIHESTTPNTGFSADDGEIIINALKWAKEQPKDIGYCYWLSITSKLPHCLMKSEFNPLILLMNESILYTADRYLRQSKPVLFLDHLIKTKYSHLKLGSRDKKELALFAKQLPKFASDTEKLITGEWASLMLSKVIAGKRINRVSRPAKMEWWDRHGEGKNSLFIPYGSMNSLDNKPINFYRRSHMTLSDDYLAALYDISHQMVFDPTATLVSCTSTGNPQFHPEFFRLSSSQISALNKFAKNEKGQDTTHSGRSVYTHTHGTESIKYARSNFISSYPSIVYLTSSLEQDCKDNIMIDARYAVLCMLFMTPPETTIQEKADLIFGDHGVETLQKIDALLAFHEKDTSRTAAFFLTNELNGYFLQRTTEEVMNIVYWLDEKLDKGRKEIQVLQICPEAAFIIARKYINNNKGLTYEFNEDFLRQHDREIMELRFGNKSIIDRHLLIQNFPRIVEQYRLISEEDWAHTLRKEIAPLLPEQAVTKRFRAMGIEIG